MATNNFNAGVLPSNFEPTINNYYGLVEKITEQVIINGEGNNPLAFLNKGDWDNGTTLEQSVVAMAEAYDFDGDALDVFAKTNPTQTAFEFTDWTTKQYATTLNRKEIRKILNGDKTAEDVAEKVVASLSEGEVQEDYDTLKSLILWSKNSATLPITQAEGTITDGASMLKAIKNAISTMKFTNTTYNSANVKSRTRGENIVLLIPTKQLNALDVDTLAYVRQLEKDNILAEIHEIDTTDGIIYIFDKNAYGYRTRLRELTTQPNNKALYVNYWLTTDKLYYFSPLYKACYIDASAVE